MSEETKVGINNVEQGFQVAFVKTADGQANIEIVTAGEKKVTDKTNALLREVSVIDSSDVSELSLEPGMLNVNNSKCFVISVDHSKLNGSCKICLLGLADIPGSVPFNDETWTADMNAVWTDGYFTNQYASPGYFMLTPTSAIADIYPDEIKMTVRSAYFQTRTFYGNNFKIWHGDYAVSASPESFELAPGESQVISFSPEWSQGDITALEFSSDIHLTDIEFPGGRALGAAGLIDEISFAAESINNNGIYFSKAQVVQAAGFCAVYPLVTEISSENELQIYAWPI